MIYNPKGGSALKIIDKIEEYFLFISLAIMVVLNFGNVISRYFLGGSWSFTEEIVIILFVWNSMLATAVAFKAGAHLGLSVVTDLLPQKMQKFVIIFSSFATVLLMVILAKFGADMVMTQMKYGQITPVLGMPEWWSGISIPVGAVFIILRVIESAYTAIKKGGQQ